MITVIIKINKRKKIYFFVKNTTCRVSAFRFFPLLRQQTGLGSLLFNEQTVAIGSEAEWEAKQVEEAKEDIDEPTAFKSDCNALDPF